MPRHGRPGRLRAFDLRPARAGRRPPAAALVEFRLRLVRRGAHGDGVRGGQEVPQVRGLPGVRRLLGRAWHALGRGGALRGHPGPRGRRGLRPRERRGREQPGHGRGFDSALLAADGLNRALRLPVDPALHPGRVLAEHDRRPGGRAAAAPRRRRVLPLRGEGRAYALPLGGGRPDPRPGGDTRSGSVSLLGGGASGGADEGARAEGAPAPRRCWLEEEAPVLHQEGGGRCGAFAWRCFGASLLGAPHRALVPAPPPGASPHGGPDQRHA